MSDWRKPKIAKVQCKRLRFEPGDKVLVKVNQTLDRAQQKKLLKRVRAWAGDGVEVILIDTRVLELEIVRSTDKRISGSSK